MNRITSKFGNVIRIIYNNIDKPIDLDEIALEAGLSLASLKRVFKEAVDQSPGVFIRRLRMELAFRSLQDRENSILETALASGFDDQSAFARRFKKTFGYPPSIAREKINIVSELEYAKLEEPDFVELHDLSLQSVTEVGLYFESAPRAWKKLKEKLNQSELTDDFSGLFIGIGHDDPHEGIVPENKVRFSACVSHIDRNIGANKLIVKGGKYARFRYIGKPNNLGLAYHYIFGQWAEKSAIKIHRKKLTFIVFERIPMTLKEQKIMVHVPLI
ncbi:MAG: hypothetical protein ACD_44C00082G0001 [uncultured bacterium]|nr:MAG: hypothetical protein ACD_44C00082G0001 [uncultured bacterium]OGT24350.1 MAG: hypothetical protein A2W47_03275 [Gammaproteobacteria bacterium RIFCSPHIGHO2_12_38_15]OGT69402.1 MAG: hypothetical protein A3I12_07910 [Gammaproteobacteria bacterium RIFCSPLOWO2_02_FULL_38_11]OGT77966.1 MAG: hypothetical protein A3G71_04880 [Gammaproteobacteria bacterium RIFCSPLOWO2_12_FULL_38_14]